MAGQETSACSGSGTSWSANAGSGASPSPSARRACRSGSPRIVRLTVDRASPYARSSPDPHLSRGISQADHTGSCMKLKHFRSLLAMAGLAALAAPAGATKYAGEFMKIAVGARAVGMGGAFSAVADDATSPYWNPAGMI